MFYLKPLVVLATLTASVAPAILPRDFNQTSEDGFPKPNTKQTLLIAEQAGGKLPAASLPSGLSKTSITTLQLIAFNELFEVAYFSSLLNNLTMNATGYNPPEKKAIVEILETVRAQEQFHALAALSALNATDAFMPSSCKYAAPVDNFTAAISVIETVTDVVLGALQGAAYNFAIDNKARALVPLIGSIIGNEGEQNGAYRLYLDRVPSSSPFLTAVPAQFAWSALQLFVVPGSCNYSLSKIDLPIFPPLMVNGGPIAVVQPKNQTLYLSANLSDSEEGKKYSGKSEGLYATFVTGQQAPYSTNVTKVKWNKDVVNFEAEFPYDYLVAGGFSHVSLTTGNNFTNVSMVPNMTLAAPGVIQVNNTAEIEALNKTMSTTMDKKKDKKKDGKKDKQKD
ncbi:ferritin-like domain-containing protein [Sarocladium implicatum]|nr:ferritin-like domain-containing protein [Sarocladium implicatum]